MIGTKRLDRTESFSSLHTRPGSSKCVWIVDTLKYTGKVYTRCLHARDFCSKFCTNRRHALLHGESNTGREQLGTMSGKCPQKSVRKKKWISLVDYSPPFCAIIGSIATNRTRKIGVILTTLFPVFSRSPVITAHLIPPLQRSTYGKTNHARHNIPPSLGFAVGEIFVRAKTGRNRSSVCVCVRVCAPRRQPVELEEQPNRTGNSFSSCTLPSDRWRIRDLARWSIGRRVQRVKKYYLSMLGP